MNSAGLESMEQRVIVLTPTSKDAALAGEVLGRASLRCTFCSGLIELARELETGAAVVIVPEEAVTEDRAAHFKQWLAHQPPWSDLPVLVMARPGADSTAVAQAMELLGNVTVLERPTRIAALISAVRSALRSRQRQYELRDRLWQQARDAETLRQRIEELQTLMDTLPVGVYFAHDSECRRIVGNRAGVQLLRSNAAANLSMTAPPDERPAHFRVCKNGVALDARDLPMQRAARGEVVRNEPLETVFDDGTLLYTLVSASPMYDSQGELRGTIAVILDVTELTKATASLRAADRRKDEFLAVLAHELRNPLAPIRNSLHILQMKGQHDPVVERLSEIMERQVSHMVRLVDDLMEVSRITRGKIELRKEVIEVAAVVRTAVETSRPLIDAADHNLTLSMPAEPLILDCDPIRLAQVLSNLLNNSAKYTESGGQIWLTVRRDESEAVISVRDTGMGIPTDMLPRVFDLFTQIDRSANRSQGGLGIGLALVKKLVEMHDGQVAVRSGGIGMGAEFTVRLPLSPAQLGGELEFGEPAVAHNTAERRILVVDDNRDAANSLAMLLKLIGVDTRVAFNGVDALDILRKYRPDVVLLDIGMPGMDGYELARRIRKEPRSENVLLIALTGWGQDQDRSRSRDAGIDHHLVKPPEISALKTLILPPESAP